MLQEGGYDKLAIQEFKEFNPLNTLPTASVYNAVMLPKDTYKNSAEKRKSENREKYCIKELHLKEQNQNFYFQKEEQIFGVYCED